MNGFDNNQSGWDYNRNSNNNHNTDRNSDYKNSNSWSNGYNNNGYSNQSDWSNSYNNSYCHQSSWINSDKQNSYNNQNMYNSQNSYSNPNSNQNYNNYNSQQDGYNANNNASNPNNFYGYHSSGDNYNMHSNTVQTNSSQKPIKNFKDFMNKMVEIGRRKSMYSDIPLGMEVVYAKEPINFKTPFFIVMIVFVTLTIINVGPVLFSGVTTDEFFAHLIGIGMHSLLVGVCASITFFPIVNAILKLLRCTEKVTAKIEDVRIETTLERDTENRLKEVRSCYPIYRYEYAGKIYIIEAARNRHIGTPRRGKKLKILINKNNPKDYYFFSIIRDALIVLLGGILLYFLLQLNIFTKYL